MTNTDNIWAAVHITHCCLLHGCKYGQSQCPVVKQSALQEYDCEFCDREVDRAVGATRFFLIELWNDSQWVVIDEFEASVREVLQELRQYRSNAPDNIKYRLRYRIVEAWQEVSV